MPVLFTFTSPIVSAIPSDCVCVVSADQSGQRAAGRGPQGPPDGGINVCCCSSSLTVREDACRHRGFTSAPRPIWLPSA
ncbi:hypothetical protein CgunFtcFv8_012735 [Champsocephalus gunnari]|nr:hypothetical protein CgunFtcFv8_012735 [Champsocephalus gunnari]